MTQTLKVREGVTFFPPETTTTVVFVTCPSQRAPRRGTQQAAGSGRLLVSGSRVRAPRGAQSLLKKAEQHPSCSVRAACHTCTHTCDAVKRRQTATCRVLSRVRLVGCLLLLARSPLPCLAAGACPPDTSTQSRGGFQQSAAADCGMTTPVPTAFRTHRSPDREATRLIPGTVGEVSRGQARRGRV